MERCPQWMLSSVCELAEYLPRLTKEEVVSFILGTFIVIFFAKDHYKIPTYAKTTIGDFIELAPESLTSAKRYRKGLCIYIVLMLGLYLAFSILWSESLKAVFVSSGINLDGGQLWPIAAATAVTLAGAAGDKNLFGRMEAALRSVAHESAYIPDAVTTLSNALSGSFVITPEMVQQLGETRPTLLAQITESQDGSIQTWIRARYLFSRLQLLQDDPEFRPLLSRPEHVRAFDFLNEELQNLADRVAQRLEANHADLDEPLRKKVESFRTAASVFLASLLWQGSGSAHSIARKLAKLGLSISSEERHFAWNFMFRVLISLGGAAALTYIVLYIFDWESRGYLADDFWHITMAVLIFFTIALLVTKRREARFLAGETDKAFDAAAVSALCYGLPIGFVATVTTLAVHRGGPTGALPRFWTMLSMGLCLAVLATLLFEIVMRVAARTPPTRGASRRLSGSMPSAEQDSDLRRMLGKAVLMYAAAFFLVAFVLFWLGQAVIARTVPSDTWAEAEEYLGKVVDGYSSKSENRADPRFNDVSSQFEMLRKRVVAARTKVANNEPGDAVTDIVKECDGINQLMTSQLGDDVLRISTCGLNDPVSKQLGEEKWLEYFREAMIRVEYLVKKLRDFQSHATAMSAISTDWPRALVVGTLWAILSAVFAASILLYRRSVLWDTINIKTAREYTSDIAGDPLVWLRTPIEELGDLTPLEAVRYPDLRAALSDHLRAIKPPSPPQLRVAA
jgi:hypothetical protein